MHHQHCAVVGRIPALRLGHGSAQRAGAAGYAASHPAHCQRGPHVACAAPHRGLLRPDPTYTTYYCAVPVAVISSSLQPWSGRLAFGGAIATSAAENSPSQIRICRYFELTDDAATPSVDEGDGNYTSVTTPLINQNYLAISAGDGSSVYACPSGTTALHQPV